MDNDLADMENALRRLKPRPPSEFCQARIAAALDVPAATARGSRILVWSAGFAAACAAIVALNSTPFRPAADTAPLPGIHDAITAAPVSPVATADPQTQAPETTHPDTAEQRALSSIEPLELRQTPDGRFFQPYRVRYLNTVKMPAAGSTGQPRVKSIPAEEVHFVSLDLI
ncbi:MAG: hypothetical protein LBV54_08475 [Puniceicoccales bacterium]|jgi:hypothetical protein|nr:hypothetical protein [Puniceicoccales bacterium]